MRRVVLTGALLVLGCKEEVELVDCFTPVGRLDIPGGLPGQRWRIGDIDGDGLEDVVGIEDLSGGTWRLHPLLGVAGDVALRTAPPVDLQVVIPLTDATTKLVDTNADGVVDLAAFHENQIVIVDGPLLPGGTVRMVPMANLDAGRGEFIDFDDDGIIDFVMREGEGDNMLSFRGTAEGTFEPASTAEFHEDIFCINRFIAYEAGQSDWLGVQATYGCGNNSLTGDARVALFSVEPNGGFTELSAADWEVEVFDSPIELNAVDNFFDGAEPELLINNSIRGNANGRLVELASVSADLRADFDGDGRLDHLVLHFDNEGADLMYGEETDVSEALDVQWKLDRRPSTLLAADINGDGADEAVVNEPGAIVSAGPLGSCPKE